MNYIVIFFVSLACILLELFFTRMLNLKAWNHIVYVIIPFAILGYGIEANIQMIFRDKILKYSRTRVLGCCLAALSLIIVFTTLAIIKLPIRIDFVLNIFVSAKAIGMLLLAYTIIMMPFVLIGFLVVYIFSIDPKDSHKLYFVDLLGGGLAAVIFYPLINTLEVFHSLFALACVTFLLAGYILWPSRKWVVGILAAGVLVFGIAKIPEPVRYAVDQAKGWEWIPGYFKEGTYDHTVSRWHPLGRTDVFRIKDKATQGDIVNRSPGAFLINLFPPPEFSYFSTNFLAGTPAYKLSKEGLEENKSRVKLFSQSMEAPYLILDKPRVLVIGAGGGRDIFMAKAHGAQSVLGAEINPGIVREMSPGGALYEYTGKIYTEDDTKIHAIDGRHLVKKSKDKSFDLIVLNGVDTFSGLSSGAYAYAESFLYTKEALEDYFRILDDDGVIMFVRWLFHPPRETLRLFGIGLEALKNTGAQNPLEHFIIGDQGWSIVLVKKTPFTPQETKKVASYLEQRNVRVAYPPNDWVKTSGGALYAFTEYGEFFQNNQIANFERLYPYDVSVMSDDRPFFYKYYKFSSFNPFRTVAVHHTGTVIFLTQALIFLQALFFIGLFIILPLYIFKKSDIHNMPGKGIRPFVIFFSCLGLGFMFIEIPVMQRYVFLLGSPIYSITVVLAVLLIATGCGSFSLPFLERLVANKPIRILKNAGVSGTKSQVLMAVTFLLVMYILVTLVLGIRVLDRFLVLSFAWRVVLASVFLFPLGFLLGVYFPSGLRLIDEKYKDSMAWAWAINGAFSVLGSITSIILAQFWGFSSILMLACIIYLIAFLSFSKMEQYLK